MLRLFKSRLFELMDKLFLVKKISKFVIYTWTQKKVFQYGFYGGKGTQKVL